jgi:hypothetical protein
MRALNTAITALLKGNELKWRKIPKGTLNSEAMPVDVREMRREVNAIKNTSLSNVNINRNASIMALFMQP